MPGGEGAAAPRPWREAGTGPSVPASASADAAAAAFDILVRSPFGLAGGHADALAAVGLTLW